MQFSIVFLPGTFVSVCLHMSHLIQWDILEMLNNCYPFRSPLCPLPPPLQLYVFGVCSAKTSKHTHYRLYHFGIWSLSCVCVCVCGAHWSYWKCEWALCKWCGIETNIQREWKIQVENDQITVKLYRTLDPFIMQIEYIHHSQYGCHHKIISLPNAVSSSPPLRSHLSSTPLPPHFHPLFGQLASFIWVFGYSHISYRSLALNRFPYVSLGLSFFATRNLLSLWLSHM